MRFAITLIFSLTTASGVLAPSPVVAQSAPALHTIEVLRDSPAPSTRITFQVDDIDGTFERIQQFAITRLTDDTGRDLLRRHRRVQSTRGDTSRALVGAKGNEDGFRLTVHPQAAPDSAARRLRIEGTVEYVVNMPRQRTAQLEGVVIEDEPTIQISDAGGLRVRLAGMSAGAKAYYRFESPLTVTRVTLLGESGETLETSTMHLNGAAVAAVGEEDAEDPLTIVIEYQASEVRTFTLGTQVPLAAVEGTHAAHPVRR